MLIECRSVKTAEIVVGVGFIRTVGARYIRLMHAQLLSCCRAARNCCRFENWNTVRVRSACGISFTPRGVLTSRFTTVWLKHTGAKLTGGLLDNTRCFLPFPTIHCGHGVPQWPQFSMNLRYNCKKLILRSRRRRKNGDNYIWHTNTTYLYMDVLNIYQH